MILFHVPAPRIRATRRHQQTYAVSPTVATVANTKINSITILSSLFTKIAVIAYKIFDNRYGNIIFFCCLRKRQNLIFIYRIITQ
jgi:hypothetical protein